MKKELELISSSNLFYLQKDYVMITDKENLVLAAMIYEGMDNLNTSEVVDLLNDNMTWMSPSEISEVTGISIIQLRGVMNSLSQKGLIVDSGESVINGVSLPGIHNNDWYVTDYGLGLAMDLGY